MPKRIVVLAVAGMFLVAAGPAAIADRGKEERRVELVASGLDSPRGLSFGPGGILYIAEAGRGGDGPCIIGSPGSEVCLGATGAVTAVWHGHQWRVADGLPSLADAEQFDVGGPHDVAVSPFGLLVPIGLGADPARRDGLGPAGEALGSLVRIDWRGGWRPIADLAAYEAVNDPDQGQPGVEHPDSNPYAVTTHGTSIIVADAGGNDLIKVKHRLLRDSELSTFAVFSPVFVDAPPFLDFPPGTQLPMQFVPTTVTRGPDHAYYVGQLTGFPFPPGAAAVWRVEPGQQPTVYAGGFTNIIDIAFDRQGRLLVLEIFTNGLLGAEDDPTGALWRVERDGDRELIADGSDGLLAPAGVAVGHDGAYYVTNKGVLALGQGEVLRISGH